MSWAVYFLTRDPVHPGKRTGGLKAGAPFPWQDKNTIRRMGPAFGVLDAMDRRFSQLDYVVALHVGTEANRHHILTNNLNLQAARRLVSGPAAEPEAGAPPARPRGRGRSAEVNHVG